MLVELIRSVVVEMGMQPEFTFLPWKRGEKRIEAGKAFAAFPYGKNANRLNRFQFSNNFFSTPTVFFYLRGTLPIDDYLQFEDLRPYQVGGNLGYNYVPWFKKAGLKLSLAVSQEQLIKMLVKKRVDLVAIDRNAGWRLIEQIYPKRRNQFATLKRPIEQNADEISSHLMVSRHYPNHSDLLVKFNQALATIIKNGTYSKIMKKYKFENPAEMGVAPEN